MKLAVAIIMLLLLSAAADSGRADIYRLEADDETLSFTDTPNDKRFRLVMKEPAVRSRKGGPGPRRLESETETATGREKADSLHRLPLPGRITSTTGLRSDPFNGRLKHHNGLDIAAPSGTPVKPVAPGRVIYSGWKAGYGNTVILDHDDGMITVYAHHADNLVVEGEQVDSETIIARSGSTGRSTGPHLHFEAWRNGSNISSAFIPDNMAAASPTAAASPPIKRFLQADGTIVFTNLR